MGNILVGKAGPTFILKSFKIADHFNRLKKKTHVIILTDILKTVFDKIQYPVMMKTIQTRNRRKVPDKVHLQSISS